MAKTKDVKVTGFQIDEAIFKIEGVTPMLHNKFIPEDLEPSENKTSTNRRNIRNGQAEADKNTHRLVCGEKYGFPAGGFKKCIVRAGKQLGYKMTDTRTMLFVIPDCPLTGNVELLSEEPVMVKHIGRCSNKSPKVTYRNSFSNWKVFLRIKYNRNAISPERIAEMIALAGFAVGIGDFRPDCNGTYGTFKLSQ